MANHLQTENGKRKSRVFLVDDHPIVRYGLAQLITREMNLAVCGEAEDARTALKAIAELKPDLVIVDVWLKNVSGIELIKTIKARHADLPILVVSMFDESVYAERVFRAGAKGYIMKQEAIEWIMRAIHRVLSGEIYISEVIGAKILKNLAGGRLDKSSSSLESLSDRELEVFQLIGRGYGTREIAEKLSLSVKTVESYREHIKEKMKLKKATELVRLAVQWVHIDNRSSQLPGTSYP